MPRLVKFAYHRIYPLTQTLLLRWHYYVITLSPVAFPVCIAQHRCFLGAHIVVRGCVGGNCNQHYTLHYLANRFKVGFRAGLNADKSLRHSMPDDLVPITQLLHTQRCQTSLPRPSKRKRTSFPQSNAMDVTGESEGSESDSSDWDGWADAMVSQGDCGDSAAIGAERQDNVFSKTDNQEEAWIKSMIDQGTDRSVIQKADSRAWEYAIKMAVEIDEQQCLGVTSAHVRDVKGVAAMESVMRWLRQNVPHAFPTLRTLCMLNVHGFAPKPRDCVGDESCELLGRAVVDSVADPSSVAVISCLMERSMPRISLFSLSANAGAALAAAVVQPDATGLVPTCFNDGSTHYGSAQPGDSRQDQLETKLPGEERDGRGGGGHQINRHGCRTSNRGVIFEYLDSRIMEGMLLSSMSRLGLALRHRSRSGIWRLPANTNMKVPIANGTLLAPLADQDAKVVALKQPICAPNLDTGRERAVRGLIRRNPSAGIRKGGQLIAWCLTLDCGLIGGLHATSASSAGEDACAVVSALLNCDAPDGDLSLRTNASCSWVAFTGGESSDFHRCTQPLEMEEGTTAGKLESRSSSGILGLVLDDDSPFVQAMRELGLVRVCDSDWMQFVTCSAGTSPEDEEGPVPFMALAMHP